MSPHLRHGTTWSPLHNRNQTALRRPGSPAGWVPLPVPALPAVHHSLRPGAQRRGREGLLPAARHARPEARRHHRARLAQGAGEEGAALAVWRTGAPCSSPKLVPFGGGAAWSRAFLWGESACFLALEFRGL